MCPFVIFSFAIVLFVLLRYTDSDYPFGIFKIFLRKESFNSDGHQLHQYQQSEQSPLILTEHITCDVGNQSPGLGHPQTCGGVKPVNEILTLDNCNTYINKG